MRFIGGLNGLVTRTLQALGRCAPRRAALAWASALALVLAIVGPLLPTAPTALAAASFTDNFAQDSSLNTQAWALGGTAVSKLLANPGISDFVQASVFSPQLSFVPGQGMDMTGVTGCYEQAGIQSANAFFPPFTVTATVTPLESGSRPIEMYLTSADGGSGLGLNGGLSLFLSFSGWVVYEGGGAGNSWQPIDTLNYIPPFDGVQYTMTIAVSADNSATVSVDGLQQSGVFVGPGPFYLVLAQGSGGYCFGPDEALWHSVTVSQPASIATGTTLAGASTADFRDPITLAATVYDKAASPPTPVAGAPVTFTLANQTCTGTTGPTGQASCTVTPDEAAGNYTLTATFAGNAQYAPSSATGTFAVTPDQTALAYRGPTAVANGGAVALSALLQEDGVTPIPGRPVTLTLGSGSTAQSCSGTTNGSGTATCTVSGVDQPLGANTVTATFAGDGYYLPASSATSVTSFAFPAHGAFVIGDGAAAVGGTVTYWSNRWSQDNTLSGGSAPVSFKGFAESTSEPLNCGSPWTTTTGASSGPPSSIPSYMGVVVASSVTGSGSVIAGNAQELVVVQTSAGYGPNLGHQGTGTVVAVVCK